MTSLIWRSRRSAGLLTRGAQAAVLMFIAVAGSLAIPWAYERAGAAAGGYEEARVSSSSAARQPQSLHDADAMTGRYAAAVVAGGQDTAYLPIGLGNVQAPSAPPPLRMVDQLGGANMAVAAAGKLVYLGAGPRLEILDVGDPARPVRLGTTAPFPGQVLSIHAHDQDGLVYIMHGSGGQPTASGGGQVGLDVVDVRDPAAPAIVGRHYWASTSDGSGASFWPGPLVAVAGFAYIAAGSRGVRILDVRDPAAIAEVGFVEWPYEYEYGPQFGSVTLYERATDIAVVGSRVFVIGGSGYLSGSFLRVLDVADPSHPEQIGEIAWPDLRSTRIAVWDQHAYVAVGAHGVQVVDVSNPSSPRDVSRVRVPSDAEWSDKALDVWTGHGMAYVLLDGTWPYRSDGQLAVFDLADPSAPKLLSHTEELGKVNRLSVQEDHVYVVGAESGLWVVDATDPIAPRMAGRYHEVGSVYEVESESGLAFLGAAGHGLRVVDVSAPGPALEIGALEVPLATGLNYHGGRRLRVRDRMAYALGVDEWWHRVLMLIDLSDPTTPVVSGSLSDEPAEGARGIDVSGGHAYVGEWIDEGVAVIDVRRPSEPEMVGVHPFPYEFVMAVHTEGRYGYVAGGPTLDVLDLQDPAGPLLVGRMDTDEAWVDVFAANGLAYAVMVGGESGETSVLRILDVSNPSNPLEMGSHSAGQYEYFGVGVVVVDDVDEYAYWADGDLRVIDVSDPWNPQLVAILPTPGYARDVAVTDGAVVVADWEGGLVVFEKTRPANDPPTPTR